MENIYAELEEIKTDAEILIHIKCMDIGRLKIDDLEDIGKERNINLEIKFLSSIVVRIIRILGNRILEATGVADEEPNTTNNS